MSDNTAPQSSAQAEKIAAMLRAFTGMVRAVRRSDNGGHFEDATGMLQAVSSEQLEAELARLGISGYDPEQVTEPPT